MDIQNLKNEILSYQETVNKILKIIGYSSEYFQEITILEHAKWGVCGDDLSLGGLYQDEPDDTYSYIISSYSAKGIKLFMGSDDEHTFIMAYDDNSRYDDTEIFVLRNSNEI